METVRRTIKFQKIHVLKINTKEVLKTYESFRKTDIIKETRKNIKNLKRVDIEVKIENIQRVYELDLDEFIEMADLIEETIQ